MDSYIRTGFSFGLASGIITTLGMMVGLYSSTQSQIAVVGAILTVAIADAFSDAIGMHISEESQDRYSKKGDWELTVSTFLFKLLFPLIFIPPVLFFDLGTAIWFSVGMGLFLLALLSLFLSRHHKIKPLPSVLGHLAVAVVVILITNYLGNFIASVFR